MNFVLKILAALALLPAATAGVLAFALLVLHVLSALDGRGLR